MRALIGTVISLTLFVSASFAGDPKCQPRKKPENRCGKLLAADKKNNFANYPSPSEDFENYPHNPEDFQNYPAPSKNFENTQRANPDERRPYKPSKQMGGPSGASQYGGCDSPKQMG